MNIDYIFTNSNILIKLLKFIINKSKKINKINNCPYCNNKFKYIYIYKKKNILIQITDMDIHFLQNHNIINTILYKQICNIKFDNFNIDWGLFGTNQINIIDGLYEIGSNQIYIEKKKNISESKIIRFSEHSGFIYFEKNKVVNINIISGSRVEQSDPLIYMPKNCLEALKVKYIFHTHPKTPYIGSRIKDGIIYEFPSISDIIHFIDHHNNGILLGSIIISPEGIYIIRKNNFNNKNITVDYDIMISNLEEIFLECYNDSYNKYSFIDYQKYIINKEIKLPDKIFYDNIAINYEYINKINKVLIKYDIFIDYYARIFFNKSNIFTNKWILDDIYVPLIN
jgi:uncharacterized protein (DUF1499 family)